MPPYARPTDRVKFAYPDNSARFTAEMELWRQAIAYSGPAGLLPPQDWIAIENRLVPPR